MPRERRGRGIEELSPEEFRALRAARRKRLEEVYPWGTIVVLNEDWIGLKKGLRGVSFVEEVVGRDVWRVAFENGFITDLSMDLDRLLERTGEIESDVDEYLDELGPWNPRKRKIGP